MLHQCIYGRSNSAFGTNEEGYGLNLTTERIEDMHDFIGIANILNKDHDAFLVFTNQAGVLMQVSLCSKLENTEEFLVHFAYANKSETEYTYNNSYNLLNISAPTLRLDNIEDLSAVPNEERKAGDKASDYKKALKKLYDVGISESVLVDILISFIMVKKPIIDIKCPFDYEEAHDFAKNFATVLWTLLPYNLRSRLGLSVGERSKFYEILSDTTWLNIEGGYNSLTVEAEYELEDNAETIKTVFGDYIKLDYGEISNIDKFIRENNYDSLGESIFNAIKFYFDFKKPYTLSWEKIEEHISDCDTKISYISSIITKVDENKEVASRARTNLKYIMDVITFVNNNEEYSEKCESLFFKVTDLSAQSEEMRISFISHYQALCEKLGSTADNYTRLLFHSKMYDTAKSIIKDVNYNQSIGNVLGDVFKENELMASDAWSCINKIYGKYFDEFGVEKLVSTILTRAVSQSTDGKYADAVLIPDSVSIKRSIMGALDYLETISTLIDENNIDKTINSSNYSKELILESAYDALVCTNDSGENNIEINSKKIAGKIAQCNLEYARIISNDMLNEKSLFQIFDTVRDMNSQYSHIEIGKKPIKDYYENYIDLLKNLYGKGKLQLFRNDTSSKNAMLMFSDEGMDIAQRRTDVLDIIIEEIKNNNQYNMPSKLDSLIKEYPELLDTEQTYLRLFADAADGSIVSYGCASMIDRGKWIELSKYFTVKKFNILDSNIRKKLCNLISDNIHMRSSGKILQCIIDEDPNMLSQSDGFDIEKAHVENLIIMQSKANENMLIDKIYSNEDCLHKLSNSESNENNIIISNALQHVSSEILEKIVNDKYINYNSMIKKTAFTIMIKNYKYPYKDYRILCSNCGAYTQLPLTGSNTCERCKNEVLVNAISKINIAFVGQNGITENRSIHVKDSQVLIRTYNNQKSFVKDLEYFGRYSYDRCKYYDAVVIPSQFFQNYHNFMPEDYKGTIIRGVLDNKINNTCIEFGRRNIIEDSIIDISFPAAYGSLNRAFDSEIELIVGLINQRKGQRYDENETSPIKTDPGAVKKHQNSEKFRKFINSTLKTLLVVLLVGLPLIFLSNAEINNLKAEHENLIDEMSEQHALEISTITTDHQNAYLGMENQYFDAAYYLDLYKSVYNDMSFSNIIDIRSQISEKLITLKQSNIETEEIDMLTDIQREVDLNILSMIKNAKNSAELTEDKLSFIERIKTENYALYVADEKYYYSITYDDLLINITNIQLTGKPKLNDYIAFEIISLDADVSVHDIELPEIRFIANGETYQMNEIIVMDEYNAETDKYTKLFIPVKAGTEIKEKYTAIERVSTSIDKLDSYQILFNDDVVLSFGDEIQQ